MRRSMWVLWVVMASAACGKKEPPGERPPTTQRPERPREQAYLDKVEAVRRLLKAGEVEAGVKAARELVDDHRLDAEGWVVIATAYQVAGDTKEALRAAKVASELA